MLFSVVIFGSNGLVVLLVDDWLRSAMSMRGEAVIFLFGYLPIPSFDA